MTTEILVLGPGCARCQALFDRAAEAVRSLGLDARVEKVDDVGEMVRRGIMASPALVVHDEVVVAGHVPTPTRIRELLEATV